MAAVAPIIIANTVQGAIVRFALSLAVSYITQKLFGDEVPGGGGNQSAADPGVKQRIPTDTSNKLPIIYGEDKIHGSIIFADISSDNQTMAFIIALCEGPIDSINTVHWDDYYLTLDSTGWVSNATHQDGTTDDWLNNNLRIVKYPEGGPCLEMEAFSSKWNSGSANRQMPDVSYVYAELKYDRENNVTGLTSKLGFEVKGKLIRLISNGGFTGGQNPLSQTLRSSLRHPEVFRKDVKFTDFSGHQISNWGYAYSGGFDTAFGRGHTKVTTNGTYTIVDLGPYSSTAMTLADWENGTPAAGLGTGAEVEFDFVQVGEQHARNHSTNNLIFEPFVPSGWTDPVSGTYNSDNGERIPNALRIKQWGNNYSPSSIDNVAGSNTTRVWLIYDWVDVFGVSNRERFALTTFEMTPTGGIYTNYSEKDYAARAHDLLGHATVTGSSPFNDASDITTWGGRRLRTTAFNDDYGNTSNWTYTTHQQYFTAPIPASILDYGYGTYSNNPAECLADYLTNKVYGCGLSISDDDLDLDTFYNHKQFCDDLVTHNDPQGNSVTSKRYECNGFVNTNDFKDLNISDIISNSQSIFSYTLGKFQMISDTTGSNQGTFNNENIYGDVTILNDGFNSNLNELTLKFKSQQDNYQDDQVFLDYTQKYYNEPILSKDLDLKFINSNVQAQRLGSVFLNKTRSSKIISFKTDTDAANLQVNDVITVKDTYYNFDEAKQLYINITNNSNDGTTSTNSKGSIKLRDYDEAYTEVLYRDGTPAIITFPYNIATNDQLNTFFNECINGMYEDTSETLTVEEIKANNMLGEYVSFIEDNTSFTTGGTFGGGFIFHLTPATKNFNSYKDIRFITITNIFGTSMVTNVLTNGNTNGKQFKINSISETELDGGLQGYLITAQEYNPDDYTVATLTAKSALPTINSTRGYSNLNVVSNLSLISLNTNASIPNVSISLTMPNQSNIEGLEIYYSDGISGTKYLAGVFSAPTGNYLANSPQSFQLIGIPTVADLYISVKSVNSFSKSSYSSPLSCGAWNPVSASTNVGTGSVSTTSIQTGAVTSTLLANTLDLSSKTVILPADAVKAHTGEWDNTIKTADFTITNQAYWQGYFVDTTSNTVTITLPASPDDGDIVKIIDTGANASVNNIIIDGNTNNIQGSSSNYNITTNRAGTEFIFLTGNGWILTNVH